MEDACSKFLHVVFSIFTYGGYNFEEKINVTYAYGELVSLEGTPYTVSICSINHSRLNCEAILSSRMLLEISIKIFAKQNIKI